MGEDIIKIRQSTERSSDKELAIAAELYGIHKEIGNLKKLVGGPGAPEMPATPSTEYVPAEPSSGLYRVIADQTYHSIAIAHRLSEIAPRYRRFARAKKRQRFGW
jgi:hypothetical protein